MLALFSSFKTWLYVGILLAFVGLLCYAGYEKHENDAAQKQIVLKQVEIAQQNQAIVELKTDINKIQTINASLGNINQDIADSYNDVNKSLDDLKNTVKSNPSLAEKQVNDDAKQRIRCFALVTGAVPQKNETNSVCKKVLGNVKK